MSNSEKTEHYKAELKAAEQAYLEQGLAVVPFVISPDGKKRPVVDSWKQWQSRTQTREEFEALQIEKYDFFGVICEAKIKVANEEFYFCVFDRDVKGEDTTPETLQKSLQAINSTKTIQREKIGKLETQGKFQSLNQVVRVALTQFLDTKQKEKGEEQKCPDPST